jgi:hypothetical protein
MNPFKIKIIKEQSEVIQKLLFLTGYSWCDGTTEVYHPIDESLDYLYFDDNKRLSLGDVDSGDEPEISFDNIINEIEQELNEKFQNRSNS